MLRIRGSIGQWPVDLTLELDDADWARLGTQLGQLKVEASSNAPQAPVSERSATQDDRLWELAQALLRDAGQLSGPDLLGQLEALSGNTGGGKRLLVRLRHSANVRVESGADAPLYHWLS